MPSNTHPSSTGLVQRHASFCGCATALEQCRCGCPTFSEGGGRMIRQGLILEHASSCPPPRNEVGHPTRQSRCNRALERSISWRVSHARTTLTTKQRLALLDPTTLLLRTHAELRSSQGGWQTPRRRTMPEHSSNTSTEKSKKPTNQVNHAETERAAPERENEHDQEDFPMHGSLPGFFPA